MVRVAFFCSRDRDQDVAECLWCCGCLPSIQSGSIARCYQYPSACRSAIASSTPAQHSGTQLRLAKVLSHAS